MIEQSHKMYLSSKLWAANAKIKRKDNTITKLRDKLASFKREIKMLRLERRMALGVKLGNRNHILWPNNAFEIAREAA